MLSTRHELFVEEYLVNGYNATRAYLKVYKDVEYESASQLAKELLKRDDIKAYIEKRKGDIATQCDITREKMIKELIDIMNVNKNTKPAMALKAIEQISKMAGLNEADKIDIRQQVIDIAFGSENNIKKDDIKDED